MHLYQEYIEEKNGNTLVCGNDFFFSYKNYFQFEALFIAEMFISKEARTLGAYRSMIKKIYKVAVENDAKLVFGMIEREHKKFKYIENLHLKTGMEKYFESDSGIFYRIETEKLKRFL